MSLSFRIHLRNSVYGYIDAECVHSCVLWVCFVATVDVDGHRIASTAMRITITIDAAERCVRLYTNTPHISHNMNNKTMNERTTDGKKWR